MFEALNDLRLVALRDLILHETHDARRLARLRERIREENVQRNPIIVANCDGAYLVLDGAHRVHATKGVGNPFILVQLTRMPDTPQSWAHVIANPRLDLLDSTEHMRISTHRDGEPAAVIETPDGEHLHVYPVEKGLEGEVRALCELQDVYPDGEAVRRVDPETPVSIADGEFRVLYRPFSPSELVQLVSSGHILPAGITRFRVKERVLGVRYPLDRMQDGDLEARNAELREFVEHCLKANRIRRYDEPVVVFE